jgi:hypothetical protein
METRVRKDGSDYVLNGDPWAHLPDWNKPFNLSSERFEAIYNEGAWKNGLR